MHKEKSMRVTTNDLRRNSKKLINSIGRGEEIVITFRGKPTAKLVPYQENKQAIEKNELFGIWSDNNTTKNVDEYVRSLRKGRDSW